MRLFFEVEIENNRCMYWFWW